jgi:uncharacterized Zn-binding protein involved in type VI secretion
MADLALSGTLDFRGILTLKAGGGKVKAGGLEVLVEQASGQAAAPVLLPPPPASPATTSLDVSVICSLNKTVSAGKPIVTQGMCLQGNIWPGFVLRGSGTVTVNHIPMNVQNEQATIFPSGASAVFNSSGQ